MSGTNESPIPPELRDALSDEPPPRRRQLERIWSLLGEAGADEPDVPSTDDAWRTARVVVSGGAPPPEAPHPRPSAHTFTEPNHTPNDTRQSPEPPPPADIRNPTKRPATRRDAPRRAAVRPAARRRRRVVAGAVALACVLAAGFLWMFWPATVSAPAGVQHVVALPDGSTVELNSETALRFTRGSMLLPFGDVRRVSLDGEAYFSVAASSRPFVVETEDARIQVVGTEFNVRARRGPSENGTVVTLASGRVRLIARGASSPPVTLSETGASARVSRADGVARTRVDRVEALDHVLAWRRSGFAVIDRPLEAVLDELERRYAVEIAPRRGVDLQDPMNLFYQHESDPAEILRDICLVHACTYRKTSRGFALSARDATATDPAGVDASSSNALRME